MGGVVDGTVQTNDARSISLLFRSMVSSFRFFQAPSYRFPAGLVLQGGDKVCPLQH